MELVRDNFSELFNEFVSGFAEFLSQRLEDKIEPVIVKEEHRRFSNSLNKYGFSILNDEIRYFTSNDKLLRINGKVYKKVFEFKKVPKELKQMIIHYYVKKKVCGKKKLKKYMKQYVKFRKKNA